ncbi:MAG: hypothetical protein QF590_04810 [Dehalococcoidia bacterium]|nr:hypothetical protein [Dehalococcoidia bacterium]
MTFLKLGINTDAVINPRVITALALCIHLIPFLSSTPNNVRLVERKSR